MSHIVIHDDSSNVTHYAEFDDLQDAASYLEDLVNQDGGASARLFALEPVEFAVKSYVRVEIGTADATAHEAPVAPSAASVAVEASSTEVITDAPVDDAVEDDTVEYVEAAMAPPDAFAPTPPMSERDGNVGGEVRRGLFGR